MLKKLIETVANLANSNRNLIVADAKIALLSQQRDRLSEELLEERQRGLAALDGSLRRKLVSEISRRNYELDFEGTTELELVEFLLELLQSTEDGLDKASAKRLELAKDLQTCSESLLARTRLVTAAEFKQSRLSDWRLKVVGVAQDIPDFKTATNRPLAALLGAIHTGPEQ